MDCTKMNTLLDAVLDGGLPESMRAEMKAHAAVCPECARKLQANEMILSSLRYLPEEANVPLAASAAWRNAVRLESQKRRKKGVYRSIAVAAALVLAVGAASLFRMGFFAKEPERQIVYVAMESDGLTGEEAAMLSDSAAAAVSGSLQAEAPEQAAQMLEDLAGEYGGSFETQPTETGIRCYILLPGENAQDFLLAASALGEDLPEVTDTEGEAEIVIEITQK